MDSIYDSEVFIDLYNVLDVDMEVKSDEIKNAYIKLVKVHHPDHGGNPEMFQQITSAYEILYNKESRKE
jgi:DnaJ family protein A protein 2